MKALVTGGGGYLGAAIVRQLRARFDDVVIVGRHAYPWAALAGADCRVVDLSTDDPALVEAMAGCDVVFHTAALNPGKAPRSAYEAVNVDGTRRVIDACRAAGVPRLVYTSTPSVAFTGEPQEGVTEESAPIARSFLHPYPETKAAAERMVLAARSPELAVVALRPRLIYGPEEPHMLPRILERHAAGRLRVIGDGLNDVALTYVGNAAAAHVQVADALTTGAACDGRAYFISDAEPVRLWEWLDRFVQGVGLPPLRKKLPLPVARGVGWVLERAWSTFGLEGEPPMTPFVATNLATSCWYDLRGARRDFGLYHPVSGDEGLANTIAAFRQQRGLS